ncbi:MAG: hypothetical protein ACREO3_09340 [Arenimonas sp.]
MRSGALPVLLVLAIAGCGDGSGGSKNTIAAKTCEESARTQLGDKTFELDTDTLGKSMAAQPDGSVLLKGSITVEPGLASESKQTLECNVRFVDGKAAPDVLRVQFIW